MAMDVHLPHAVDQSITIDTLHSLHSDPVDKSLILTQELIKTDNAQSSCADASSHCSHNQAHSTGLLAIATIITANVDSVSLSYINQKGILNTQAPPVRPPKA